MNQTDSQPFARYRDIIDDWDAFQESVQRPLPTTIWANPLKTTPQQLAQLLRTANIPHEPISWYPGAFNLPPDFKPGLRWEYLAGLYQVQEAVALLPVLLLDMQPGQRVLDLCAAPGNKTAQMSVALQNRGTVVANDRSAGRMRAARQTFNRLGLVNITATTVDGGNYSRHAGDFDRILADVPCTCEGTCRKDSSLLTRPVNSAKLVGSQTALLRKAVQRCLPGGRIVYATCTFAPEENEQVVDTILREFGDEVALVPARLPDGFVYSSGLTAWEGQALHPALAHAVRVWPHQNDTGGFFMAVLQKADGAVPPDAVEPTAVAEERQPWLDILQGRFGLEPSLFDAYHIFRPSRKRVYIVNRDHQPPERPSPDSIGMHFMRVDGRYPKLTTAAAMLFGAHATRNVVDLRPEQVTAFIARQEFVLDAAQQAQVTDNGYIMLRWRGVWLGQGAYYADGHRVESLFPKAWSRPAIEP